MHALLNLLMVLCLACTVNVRPACSHCGEPVSLDAVSPDRFEILPAATTGTTTSATIDRKGPNLVVDAFLIAGPGSATVSVLEAPRGGQLQTATDSNNRRTITGNSRWMVKGVLGQVAIQAVVTSGVWAVWGAWNQQPSDRGQYYDRNAAMKTLNYNQTGIAPHGETVRGSYTVSAARNAYVESVYLEILRASAAGTPGDYGWVAYYTPSGGSSQAFANVKSFDNATTNEYKAQVGDFGLLVAGDSIDLRSHDLSTGGTVSYLGHVKAVEFDV